MTKALTQEFEQYPISFTTSSHDAAVVTSVNGQEWLTAALGVVDMDAAATVNGFGYRVGIPWGSIFIAIGY